MTTLVKAFVELRLVWGPYWNCFVYCSSSIAIFFGFFFITDCCFK